MLLGGSIAHQLEHCINKQLERLYANLRSERIDKKKGWTLIWINEKQILSIAPLPSCQA